MSIDQVIAYYEAEIERMTMVVSEMKFAKSIAMSKQDRAQVHLHAMAKIIEGKKPEENPL